MTIPKIPTLLTTLMAECAVNGIGTRLLFGFDRQYSIAITDGFYKSEGCVYVSVHDKSLWLTTRYNGEKVISGFEDLVFESHYWWSYSKDRFDGWKEPPAHWKVLYERFCLTETTAE